MLLAGSFGSREAAFLARLAPADPESGKAAVLGFFDRTATSAICPRCGRGADT